MMEEIYYLVFELADGGELYNFIDLTRGVNESIARFFFKQLINGLNFCHNKGIVHRDLKLENILLDSEYTLKIADFGFAESV
jgi:serine/threonine protein kinase